MGALTPKHRSLAKRTKGLASGLLFAIACSPAVSSVPFANADPEGPDVYYYGDARGGGKTLPKDGDERTERAAPKKPEPTSPTPAAEPVASASASPAASATPEANLPEASWEKLPGTYRGTDTLTIEVPGFPTRVEKDDKAKLVVASDDDHKDRFTFDIIDSQNGTSLCSVVGVAKKSRIEFEPAQSCLEEILGLPMTAKLESGSATLHDKTLTVDYEIQLELDSANGPQPGRIGYHFAGDRE